MTDEVRHVRSWYASPPTRYPRRQLFPIEKRQADRVSRIVSPPRTRTAFLTQPLTDRVTQVVVQVTDPQLGSRGMTLRARVRVGAEGVVPNLPVGSPVTVTTHHGQLEVIGYSGQTAI